MKLIHRDLGRMAYKLALCEQMITINSLSSDANLPNQVLFVEHDGPVYTGGKRMPEFEQSELATRLRSLGAECYSTERGGQLTWHGPGQLTIYPIMRIGDAVRPYVSLLEKVIVEVGSHYGIPCRPMAEVGVCTAEKAKFGFVGIRRKGGIAYHGISINVNNSLGWFDHIVPCGMPGLRVTSLQNETGRDVSVDEVKQVARKVFTKTFNEVESSQSVD